MFVHMSAIARFDSPPKAGCFFPVPRLQEMLWPPIANAKLGRSNLAGESILYICDHLPTAVAELSDTNGCPMQFIALEIRPAEAMRFAPIAAAIDEVSVYDTDPTSGEALAQYARRVLETESRQVGSLHETFEADTVIFTTTAGRPYITDTNLLRRDQVILNISLRDLAPELILAHWNIVDDISHCLKAQTSPHLAEQATGRRDFIAGTLADVMRGRIQPDRSRALIFSPFGLGILDLALGQIVLAEATRADEGLNVTDFFAETQRWEGV
jgi:hypothetical protein